MKWSTDLHLKQPNLGLAAHRGAADTDTVVAFPVGSAFFVDPVAAFLVVEFAALSAPSPVAMSPGRVFRYSSWYFVPQCPAPVAAHRLKHGLQWHTSSSCYPFYSEDPFIIKECPHVYFAGNCTEYKTKLYKSENGQEVLLVAVPKFSQTATPVLVNLRSLECQPISSGAHFSGPAKTSPEVDK